MLRRHISGLVLGGVHGTDERAVFDELCRVVEEAVAIYRAEDRPLPEPTASRKLEDAA